MEHSFFFQKNNKQRLFGILHIPDLPLSGRVAIVYCSPIFEEKLHSHRILVNFSRYAADKGFHVLRFDYYGDGESEGLFEEASIESRILDIESAVEFVEKQFNPELIILLGLRLGGTLAILAAKNLPQVRGIVAWTPIINVNKYLYEILKINLSYQMAAHKKIIYNREALVAKINSGESVNIEGYELSNPFFNQAIHINLLTDTCCFDTPLCVINISENDGGNQEIQKFVNDICRNNTELKNIEEVRFWLTQKRIYPPCTKLYSSTTDWAISIHNHLNFSICKKMYNTLK